jgi:hypothetical protein
MTREIRIHEVADQVLHVELLYLIPYPEIPSAATDCHWLRFVSEIRFVRGSPPPLQIAVGFVS